MIAQAGEGEETLFAELDLAQVAKGWRNLDTDGQARRGRMCLSWRVDTREKGGVTWKGRRSYLLAPSGLAILLRIFRLAKVGVFGVFGGSDFRRNTEPIANNRERP